MSILDNESYGRMVTFSTDGTLDYYLVGGASTFTFPVGTSQDAAYLSIAKQTNLTRFQAELQAFMDYKYTVTTRMNIQALYVLASKNGLTNRTAYLEQFYTWAQSVISYAAAYVTSVNAMSDAAAIAGTFWNFSSIVVADPYITPLAAVAILT